uniref:Uncharacterized protein n=1 Tax=Anguilla anguilla TaxID=7936 RepID=A0A0E9RKN4_ANGAN
MPVHQTETKVVVF